MGSSRLPGKVLMPMGGPTALDHVLRRAMGFALQVAVCTSELPDDDAIEAHCAAIGCVCVRGPAEDVFQRFRKTLTDPRVAHTPWFARVTADCPLLSTALAQRLVASAEPGLDVVTVRNEEVARGLPVELVRRACFEAIDPQSLDAPQREHVTLCFYERPERYTCRFVEVPEAIRHPEFRLTLDYPEDYELLRRLLEADPELSGEGAVARLLREPELAAINRHRGQKAPRQEAK
jgi:spore coat polysaccharide biosynthesis protein SpsF